MWSLEYTQVPLERKLKRCAEVSSQEKPESMDKTKSTKSASTTKSDNKNLDLFKQMKNMDSDEKAGKQSFNLFQYHFVILFFFNKKLPNQPLRAAFLRCLKIATNLMNRINY